MKTFLILAFASLMAASPLKEDYNPFVDGAEADVRVHVVDDEGMAVKDADVSVVLLVDVQKCNVVKGKTNAGGCFLAQGDCIGEMRLWVRKSGYYDAKTKPRAFRRFSGKEATRTHRWSDGTVTIEVVLKKVRSPIRLGFRSCDFRPFPATNEVVKLDLEMLDWCPPYGKGKHDDVHLVFDGWRNSDDWDDYHEHLKVSFPNGADGFYRLKVDPTSAFKYAYTADTNQVYSSAFEFRHVHTKDGIVESKRFPKDEYLVYRVRTQTNEVGQVVHANYGRIGESFGHYIGLSMKCWFNPNDNDANLEDAKNR